MHQDEFLAEQFETHRDRLQKKVHRLEKKRKAARKELEGTRRPDEPSPSGGSIG